MALIVLSLALKLFAAALRYWVVLRILVSGPGRSRSWCIPGWDVVEVVSTTPRMAVLIRARECDRGTFTMTDSDI